MGIYEKSDDAVEWVLLEYVSPAPAGRKVISVWRSDMPTVARKADMDVFLRNMVKKPKWGYPEIGGLAGKHLKGFRELRWRSDGVPHRIGGYFVADNEFVMLVGFTHKNNKYDPPTTFDLLVSRQKKVKSREASLCEYKVLISGRA